MFKKPRWEVIWLSLLIVAAIVATSGIGVVLAKGPPSQPGLPLDQPSLKMVYTLELQDIWGEFSTISGLGAWTEIIEYQDGDDLTPVPSLVTLLLEVNLPILQWMIFGIGTAVL